MDRQLWALWGANTSPQSTRISQNVLGFVGFSETGIKFQGSKIWGRVISELAEQLLAFQEGLLDRVNLLLEFKKRKGN